MPVIYMDRRSVESLTVKDIRDIIESNMIGTKYDTLHDYYIGNHKILRETKRNSADPNNRLVANMAKYITDTATGYFLGQPVIYSSGNEAYLEALQDIFDLNDEQDHNMELAKECSICGGCFEMLYLDEEGRIRFTEVPAGSAVMIYETDSGHQEPAAAIRVTSSMDKDKNMIRKAEFWTASQVLRLRSFNGGAFSLEGVEEHYWQAVPFVEYVNNKERTGDFEGVISQIDAYNRVQSNTANFFQYNDDALLKVTKLGDVTTGDIKEMREKGAIILEDGGDVQWLMKEVSDTGLENYKSRLQEDIHTMASVPHLCDESFGGNLSGVAISYKLWGLEQLCAMKERKFKRGIQRRIRLITNILNILGGNYDYRDINMKFRRNRPQNDLETAQIVTMLANDLSRETRLQMIPSVDDVQEELGRLQKEKDQDSEDFGVYQKFAEAFRTPAGEGAVTDGPEGE